MTLKFENFIFVKIPVYRIYSRLYNRAKPSKTNIFISITLQFANFTQLNTQFCNEMYRSFAIINDLIIIFLNCHKS